jgi:hypothetical protein
VAVTGEEPKRAKRQQWPVSAICVVAVLMVVTILLGLMALFGIQLDGSYDPATGGTLAEWLEALGTLIAFPAAILFGVRQLQSTSEQIELGRQQLLTYEQERIERAQAEHVRMLESLHLRTYVANVLDRPDLATPGERAEAEKLRAEYRVRGWVPTNGDDGGNGHGNGHGNGTWDREGERRTNAELLSLEPSPLLAKPWFAAVECANHGTATVTLQRWTMVLNGWSAVVETPTELRAGGRAHRRLGPDAGFKAAYPKPGDVESLVGELRVQIEATDAADRQFQITALQE